MPRKTQKKEAVSQPEVSVSESEQWEDDNRAISEDEDCEEKYILYRILQVPINAPQEEIVN